MGLISNVRYRESVKSAAESLPQEITAELQGKKVLITGSTGLIGSAITDVLMYLSKNGCPMTIYACGRKPESISARFSEYTANDGFVPTKYDATGEIEFDMPVDYIIHAASNATPAAYTNAPVDTMMGNIMGVHRLLNYAAQCNAKRLLYVSSGEVYGQIVQNEPLREDSFGDVDILSPRSSYPMGKRAAETLCVAHSVQYGNDVVIVRPCHVYGPTATAKDGRVASSFAYLAAKGENIVMKSKGEQRRSWCHCLDCATAIITVIIKGENRNAYNIANPAVRLTIHEMAETIAEVSGVKLITDLPSESEKAAFNPMMNAVLDSTKLEGLGWKGVFTAKTGFASTVDIIRDEINR